MWRVVIEKVVIFCGLTLSVLICKMGMSEYYFLCRFLHAVITSQPKEAQNLEYDLLKLIECDVKERAAHGLREINVDTLV